MRSIIKAPLKLAFVLYRLTATMGWAFVPGLFLLATFVAIMKYIRKARVPYEKSFNKLNEKISNSTTDALNDIKSLKIYGWDNHFEEEIN